MRHLVLLSLLLSLAGCAVKPYKMEVQQGNAVTTDQIARLKPGMTRSQVRYVLGSPLVADPFHPQRWDYLYRLYQDGTLTRSHTLTLIFKDDQLQQWQGDALPPLNTAPASGN
jgi:outer membrane protein assembly factor BamE